MCWMVKSKMAEVEERRIITSAIEGMSVAEVRRALATMRKSWEETCSDEKNGRPFYMACDVLVRGKTVQEFSYMFVQGHHAKRISKNRGSSSVALQLADNTHLCTHGRL